MLGTTPNKLFAEHHMTIGETPFTLQVLIPTNHTQITQEEKQSLYERLDAFALKSVPRINQIKNKLTRYNKRHKKILHIINTVQKNALQRNEAPTLNAFQISEIKDLLLRN
jgi:hypothetical protein